ncbi:MAG: alginate lyase family protein, partial [Planctomycetota bacterium]
LGWLVEGDYAAWLQRSERNNIGTYYDNLVGTIAIHFGQEELARQRLETFVEDRVLTQVQPDGSMPAELRRTLSLSYCVMNLVGLLQVGLLCEHLAIPALSLTSDSGRRLSRAIDAVLPAAIGETAWAYDQIQPLPQGAATLLAALVERSTERRGLVSRAALAEGQPDFPGLHAATLIPVDYVPIGAWRGPGKTAGSPAAEQPTRS